MSKPSFARDIRLQNEYDKLRELRSNYIKTEGFGDPPDRYIVTYTCTGLYRDKLTGEIRHSNFHQMEIILAESFPLSHPEFRWLTPIFHPNITDSGMVCIKDIWEVSRNLATFVVDIGELVQYKRFNIYDPVNAQAAFWTRDNLHILPIGRESLLEAEQAVESPHVQIVVGDFIGTMLQGDSSQVHYTITEGPKAEEIKDITRLLGEMLAVISVENSLKPEVKRDYAIEVNNLKNEICKSKPNASRIREMLAFLGDVEGTVGLATRLAPYLALLTPIVQQVIAK